MGTRFCISVDTQNKMKIFALILVFILQPSLAYADVAVPILAIVNLYSFGFALIFIILIEYFYLVCLYKKISKKVIFKWSLYINIVTTIVGAILLPALVTAMGLIAVGLPKPYASILTALSTWSTGLRNISIWAVCLIILFWEVVAYLLTVWIETVMLYRFQKGVGGLDKSVVKKHCFIFNGISYAFLGIAWLIASQFL